MAYIKNNWVDREGTTRYFETVDTDGAKIFTPDYTQVTELGTPVNADNMNHIEEGIEAGSFTKYDTKTTYALNDLVTVIEDASPVIYKSLKDNNIGNALSDSAYWEKISLGGGGDINNKITNCLLEVPQNIKLELNDGTLTLKAGSVVTVPNGKNTDGSLKFDYVTVASDIVAGAPYTNGDLFIYYYKNSNSISQANNSAQCSGTSSSIAYGYWYDTVNNFIKRVNNNIEDHSGESFPLGIINASNGSWSSIDQVFNGIGYIGSTIWVDKGVKALMPNGRNEDGTLRNIELTSQKVSIVTNAGFYQPILYVVDGNGTIANSTTDYWIYDEVSNHYKHNNDIGHFVILAQSDTTNGVISNFQPKQPFRAVDYNEAVLKSSLVDIEEAGSTITSLCMPDYSARYTVTTSESSPKTATEDCIFVVDNSGNNTNVCIFVNGLCVVSSHSSANARTAGYAIVPKGISYYATNYNRTGNPAACTQYIIPLKGTR